MQGFQHTQQLLIFFLIFLVTDFNASSAVGSSFTNMENLINIHLDIWWYAKTTMLFAMLILFNLILKTYMPIYISGTATIILGTVIIWQYLLEPADRRNFLSIIPFDLRSYSNL